MRGDINARHIPPYRACGGNANASICMSAVPPHGIYTAERTYFGIDLRRFGAWAKGRNREKTD